MKAKTVIYLEGGLLETPLTEKEVYARVIKGEKIDIFIQLKNDKSGQADKYLCKATINSAILYTVDLEGECLYDSWKATEKARKMAEKSREITEKQEAKKEKVEKSKL